MTDRRSPQRWAGLLALLLLAGLPAAAAASPFSALYAFGDSLSDTGNIAISTGGAVPVSPPYDASRFTNAPPVAVEALASALGLTVAPSLGGGTNFAFGGARTGTHVVPPGLLLQVGMFDAMPGAADPTALYFVFAGGNDLRDAAANPGQALTIVDQAVDNMGTALLALYGLGARSFFVPNLPNIGRTPEALDSGNPAGATMLSTLFNDLLAAQLDAFAGLFPDVVLYRFNTFAFLEGVIANAGALGFTNTTDRCVTTLGCNPDEFIFWDDVHPTARTHALFGAAMAETIPEPAMLMLFGLGVVAVARRRATR